MKAIENQPRTTALSPLPAAPRRGAEVSLRAEENRRIRESHEQDGMGRKIAIGGIVIVAIFGGLGTWSATASLDGAIVAPGQIQVETSRKAVQHLEGGIVKEIRVRDGDRVTEGQLLIRLWDKSTGANLRLVQGQVAELVARRDRLLAEREGGDRISTSGGPNAASEIVEGQKALLAAKRENRRMEIGLLRQQQEQLRTQIAGMKEQSASKERQFSLFEDELSGLRILFEKGLTPKGKLLSLERAAETNRGERAVLTGNIASSEMKITELELQILRLGATSQEKVAEELRTVEAEINELSERLVSSRDQVERTDVVSPRAGRVYKLAVHAPGAVIKGGDVIMEIVPEDDTLVVGAQIAPRDIDKVQAGASAKVRLSAFNQRTTPEIDGEITQVSPDMITEPQTGRGFYLATIAIPPKQIERLAGVTLKPGMPAESIIRTGSRTPLSYLLKPFNDSITRTMREE